MASEPGRVKSKTKAVSFPSARGELLAARLELPVGGQAHAFGLFVHCFTCSKDIVAAARISKKLASLGIGMLRFDFTGVGDSQGEFVYTSFTTNVEDIVAAAAFLEREVGRAPTLLIGHSLGGAAAIEATARLETISAVATIGTPSDPMHLKHLLRAELGQIERAGEADVELAGRSFTISREFVDDLGRYDLLRRIRKIGKALVVYHSPRDATVHIDHARKIFQAARHPKSFISLDDADHLLSRREDSAFVAETLAGWARRYVGPNVPRAASMGTEDAGGVGECCEPE